MRLQLEVEVPDPRFPIGSFLATPSGELLHVHDILSRVSRANSGATVHQHTYLLVVQQSTPSQTAGTVILAHETPASLIHRCRLVRGHHGPVVSPRSIDS